MRKRACWIIVLAGVALLPHFAAGADPAKEAYLKGKAFYKKGDSAAAVAAFSKAICLDPRNVDAYCARGAAYGDKGDFDREM